MNEKVKFITTIEVPAAIAAKMTEDHWHRIDFIIQDALRLVEPEMGGPHIPWVYTRPAEKGE